MSKLKVHTVGDLVTSIKAGDIILVDPSSLSKAPLINLSNDEEVILVSPFDVIMIW